MGKKRDRNEARKLAATTAEVHRKDFDDGRVGLRLVQGSKVICEVILPNAATAVDTIKRWTESAEAIPLPRKPE